jgi:hypothetical protein
MLVDTSQATRCHNSADHYLNYRRLNHLSTDDGYWRIKTNQEINEMLKGQNIIGFIKTQRLNRLGRVERMAEENNV